METYTGTGVNGGFSIGKTVKCRLRDNAAQQMQGDKEAEKKLLKEAVLKASDKLKKAAETADKKAADILSAQLLMLSDEAFFKEAAGYIEKDSLSAADASVKAGEKFAIDMENTGDAYLMERAADYRQAGQMLWDALTGFSDVTELKEDSVLISPEFTPAQLSAMDKTFVKGLCAQKGSASSHTAILAANYGIPYIYGIDVSLIPEGARAVVSGAEGIIYVNPNTEILEKAGNEIKKQEEQEKLSCSDTVMKVYCNISGPGDLLAVKKYQADGIGLFRTEFLYMNRDSAPSEEEQFLVYKEVLSGMEGKEVVIRTADIGTDKPAPYLPIKKEENPQLGLRGVRVSLKFPELFHDQLRALLRAACFGNESVMFPMITSVSEINEIKEHVNRAAEELKANGIPYKMPRLGIMVETPAAALCAEELSEHVDFFSIGTNDLTQYTLALDREAEGLSRYYEPHHSAILSLIEMTVKGAHKNGKTCAICGQLGSDGEVIPAFCRMGLDDVSVAPASVPRVRASVSSAEKELSEEENIRGSEDGSLTAVPEEICSPCDGELIPMAEIPDKTFAEGILGECFGVESCDGKVYAPVSGTVANIAGTCHAISIKSDGGADILIHCGIDTVTLNGEGFSVYVKEGDRVNKGDILLSEDIEFIKGRGLSPMVITVLCG